MFTRVVYASPSAIGSNVLSKATSDTTNFARNIPITMNININFKCTLTINTPTTVLPVVMTYVQYFLPEPNIDIFSIVWVAGD